MTRRWVLALLLVAACDSDASAPLSSAELSTGEISLNVLLRSNGGVAQILVSPLSVDYYPIELTGGDELLFGPAGDPSQRLTPFESSYIGQLATDALDFDLVLARSGGARFTSQLSLPPGFALSVPPGPVSRADTIPITWEAAEGPFLVALEVDGPCLEGRIVRSFEQDVGSYAIQPADLFVTDGTQGCDFQVMVTRSGTYGRFSLEISASSRARTEQTRTATIATVP